MKRYRIYPSAFVILHFLENMQDEISVLDIGHTLNMSEKTVKVSLRYLTEINAITKVKNREKTGKITPNKYLINSEEDWQC